MKLKKLIEILNTYDKYMDTEVEIECPNELLVSPSIKFNLKDERDFFNRSPENVESIVISWRD